MRRSLILLAAAVPLTAVLGFSAIAGGTAPATAPLAAGKIDLDQIPIKPVTGPLSVTGVADDDDARKGDDGALLLREADDGATLADSEDGGLEGEDD